MKKRSTSPGPSSARDKNGKFKAKSPDNSAENQNSNKKSGYEWEDYFNTRKLMMAPANLAFKKRLAEELIEFATNPKSFIFDEFLNLKGIGDDTFYNWCEKVPELEAAHKFAMTQLGINRERLCIERNLGVNSTTAFMMPHYSKRWRNELEWRSKLNKDNNAPGNVVVVMKPFGDNESE